MKAIKLCAYKGYDVFINSVRVYRLEKVSYVCVPVGNQTLVVEEGVDGNLLVTVRLLQKMDRKAKDYGKKTYIHDNAVMGVTLAKKTFRKAFESVLIGHGYMSCRFDQLITLLTGVFKGYGVEVATELKGKYKYLTDANCVLGTISDTNMGVIVEHSKAIAD